MEENIKEFYCVAQNPRVALGIRRQFYDEANKYGIDPKYFVTWEDRAVIWSRTVFADRFRLFDVDNNKIIWGGKNTNGEFKRREGAKRVANKLIKEGKLKNFQILRWNRRFKRWDVFDPSGRIKPKLSGYDKRGIPL